MSSINLKGKKSKNKNNMHIKEVSVDNDGIVDTVTSLIRMKKEGI